MAFLTKIQLENIGFKYIGNNVQISDKVSIYNPDQIEIGDNSRIDDFCVISGKVAIGKNIHIAIFCNVVGGEKDIVLEDFPGLACGCHVFSQSDDYSGGSLTNPTIPDRFKKRDEGCYSYLQTQHCWYLINHSSRRYPFRGNSDWCYVYGDEEHRTMVNLRWYSSQKNKRSSTRLT